MSLQIVMLYSNLLCCGYKILLEFCKRKQGGTMKKLGKQNWPKKNKNKRKKKKNQLLKTMEVKCS
jgi:hypothetical protein